MKVKTLSNRLDFNKTTIAHLDDEEQRKALGAGPPATMKYSNCYTCDTCITN